MRVQNEMPGCRFVGRIGYKNLAFDDIDSAFDYIAMAFDYIDLDYLPYAGTFCTLSKMLSNLL